MKVMYNFVAANRVRQSVCLKNQTEQMDNHFVTFIKFVLTYNFCHYLAGGQCVQCSNIVYNSAKT